MAIVSYAKEYEKYLANKSAKNEGTARDRKITSDESAVGDIVLGTLFMNPAKIARGVESATGKETSEGAKKALGWASLPGAKVEQGFFGAAEGITDFLAGGAAQIAGQKDAAKWIYDHSWSRDAVGSDVTDEFVGDALESKGYQLASDLLSGVGNVAFQIAVGTLIGSALAAPVEVGTISKAGARAIQYAPLFFSASGSGTAENMQKTGNLGWRENVGGLLKGGVEVLTEIASPTGRIANAALFGKSAKGMSRYLVKHAIAKNIIVNFAEEAGEEAASYVGDYYIEKWLKISDDKFSWGDLGYQAVLGGITGALFSSPSDISFVRQARKAGATVYAQGEAAVRDKINEGLIEVAALKERGLNNDNVKLAEAALAKLTTDENLSQTTKEYYLGLAEQMVLKQNLSDQYNVLAKELVAKAKADPATAQSMADAFNALVNEAGGEGKYTAADFTNENSEAARIYVVAQMANDWLSRSDAQTAMDEIMRRKATLYQGTEEQKTAIRSMEDGSTVAFRVGNNAYAVVTKRAGTDTYSVGFTTPGQVERDGAVYATHKLSAEKVEKLLSKPMTEQQIDAGILNRAEANGQAQAQEQAQAQAEKPKPKPKRKRKPKPTTTAETAQTEAETRTEAAQTGASLSPTATETAQTEQTTEQTSEQTSEQTTQQAQTETTEKKVAPEDLSTVEKRLATAFGIDGSEFTKEEWTKARECVPNIDGLTRREQARVLTLVRTAQANGINEDYMKGLARLSSVYGFGVVFEDIDVSGFYSRKNGMVVINPKNLDETFGHEIEHSFDQIIKEGKAEFRTDLSEKVKRIVGASVFDRAKAQYKADYEKLRARDGSVAELSDAELEAEATANVVGKYLSNMTILKKLAATDYSLGRGLLAAIRRMKDKWTSAKAFAKENDSTAFAEYRKMTRIERLLMQELAKRDARKAGDTAYSPATAESDSDGNTLSYGQQNYFARSKVRDANGRLLVVYHGTDADFDTFDLSRAGKNGRQEGFGFYFAANQEITKKYGEKQKKVYLNIEKPLYDNRRTVTKAELRKFANALVDYQVNENGEDWRDTFISNYVDTYSTNRANAISQFVETVWEANENDQDLIYEIANGSGMNYAVDTMEPFYDVLYQSIGYDGNISTWKHEGGTDTIYVTFHPEQAKYVSNFDPTSSTDLRFSPASAENYSPVSAETNARYLELARDPQKNESELRRLVKEAAEKAGAFQENGVPVVFYHGTTNAGFTVFQYSEDRQTGTDFGKAFYFTTDLEKAKGYAYSVRKDPVFQEYEKGKEKARQDYVNNPTEETKKAYFQYRYDGLDLMDILGNKHGAVVEGSEVKSVYLILRNPLIENAKGEHYYNVYPDYFEKARAEGNDGIVVYDVIDNPRGREKRMQVGIVFEESQVKSADPVTYDDSGNIIPLSERFNPQNNDIRYSPASYGGKSGRYVAQSQPARQTIREKITNKAGQLNRQGFRNALKEGGSVVEGFKIGFVNAQQAVENQLVRAGMTKREAAAVIQYARTGRSHAFNAAQYKLADMTGEIRSEGLLKIIEPFLATKGEVYDAVDKEGNKVQSTAKGGEMGGRKYIDFGDYYSMLHALDREAAGNNPYSDMTVADMKRIVAEYEKENPDFKAAAEKLSAFNSALLDIEVQAGIRSQENADKLRKKYPHYIPMYVQEDGEIGRAPVKGARNMEVRRDNKAATESNHRVNDAIKNYLNQVERRIRAAKFNLVLQEVYNSADDVNVVKAEDAKATARDLREREKAYLENPETETDPAEMFRKVQKGRQTVNEVSFYMDGKRVTMAVTDRIYTGLSDLAGIHSSILDLGLVKFVAKINSTFKKLVTNWNPFFAVKNIARDLQDGTLQSRFGMGEFLNMYRKNAEMMATGKYNEMWEEFLANGGLESSLYSDEFGTFTKGGKSGLEQATGIVGQFQHIKNFNTLTEALPRFTEYCLTRKHGGSVQTALLNAADVTVNFGRSGTLIRILNSTVSPFLNPAVQGLDRVIRLFTEDGIKNNKALASLLLKAVLLAIVPMALGNAMYGDDDEYKDMKDSIKENNYLFKVGDTWLKLPRGRVVSTVSGLFNRSYKQLTGQETDWVDYGKNVLDQITPAQNVARHIGSPFYDVANNRTWYGTKIESDALQNYAVNQRYDENTSRISVWIGQLTSHFGLSPKEVNYLIDQYTGVVGDILLPTTTPSGTKGVVSYNFTVDPNASSNLSNRFYDLYNKTMYKSNDGDVEAYYLKKRLDETKSAVSELFKQIKTINASSELSNKEKVKQASAIRASINQLYKTALDDRRLYEQNIKDALAIENSYAVEKITAQSAKRYGLDSDAVGKYALTFGGDFAKQFNTEAQANDYKADASKKTVYAEANRLTYGAEYALKEYNVNVYEKAAKLNELGISYDEYYNYYMTVRYYSGKDKKQKILSYLKAEGMTQNQIALMMYYSGYTAYADDAKKAIKASSLSAERKKELLAGITK